MRGGREASLARFSVFALLAVMLPAAVVAVLGYVSLRQWQASAELLFREQSRAMAAMAAEKIRMVLGQREDEVVSRLRGLVERPGFRPDGLDRLLAPEALVEHLYLFDRRGRLLFPTAEAGHRDAMLTAVPQEMSDAFWERGGRRSLVIDGQPILAVLLRPARGTPVLAAISWNLDVLRRDILPRTVGAVEGPSIVAVVDGDERPVYSRVPLAGADRVVTVSVGDELPAWRVALYQPAGMSPRAAARRQITLFTAAWGLLLVVIAAGLVATYRLVRGESQMARLKADFVANVSHDLKTPLSLIRMFAETLEMGRVADEGRRQEYYRVVIRESERLSRLIDNVLDFSRIEGGRQTYDIAPTAVEPLVRDTVESFDYLLAEQGFDVRVEVAADLADVPLDAAAVGQALANLIDNAIKYSGETKSLAVDARIDGGDLTLSVTDQGIGIPLGEHQRIFEKFYRVGRSDTQGHRGSGVGLALVRHIAEAHDGRVTLESRPGYGSRFTLWFPLERRASTA